MADALCGPSNALQNFQKHSTFDRTLQQDHLTTRHSPSHGFRSSPGPSAGLLDSEFEAFQAGQIPLPHPEAQPFHAADLQNSYAPQQLNQPASTVWASDFQNLSIANPPPQFQQRSYAQQSQPRQLGNSWQNEFAKQQSQPVGPASSNYAGYNSLPFQRLSTIAPMAPLQAPSYTMTAGQGQLEQSQAQSTEAFDEEAFARAFDQAAQSELAMEQVEQQQSLGVDQGVLVNESAERLMRSEQVLEPQRLGADLIHDPREGEGEQQQQDDPDALARTAGQLLDSVKDNQSDKFQKSQFLELMRQLRDREVMVEGDKIVGVQSENSKGKDALEKSLLSIARQLSLLDFARVEPLLTPAPSSFRPVPDQLILGAFIRTLMHVSAALDILLSHYPDLMQRAKPFGMSIGVEVFALAQNPLIDAYPALKRLVLSFKSQFLELGIDPRMVRRATDLRAHTENEDETPEKGEAQLRAWLGDWLGSIAKWQNRGAQWLLSSQQIQELLGSDIYPYAAVESGTGRETGLQPTQEHLDRIKEILGPHVLNAMLKIWTSPHTRVFANPLISEVEDFEAYVADVARLEAGKGEPALDLEMLFPKKPKPLYSRISDLEEYLLEQGGKRPLTYEEQLQLLEEVSKRALLRAAAEGARESGGAAERWE